MKFECSSFSESIPDFSTIISLILWLQRPIVPWIDSNHVRMLMRFFSIQLRFLAHSSWSNVLIFREDDINFSWGFLFLWIWSWYNILRNKINFYFPLNFLVLFEAFVHFLSNSVVLSIVVMCQRFIFQFCLWLFPFFSIYTCVVKIVITFINLMMFFWFNSKIIGLWSFFSLWWLCYLYQIRWLQRIIFFKSNFYFLVLVNLVR